MPPKRKVADSSGDVVREEAKKASTFKKARSTKDIGSDAGSVCSTGGIKVGTDGTKAKPKPKPKPKGERNAVTIETGNEAGSEVSSSTPAGVIPKRNKRGQLVFADYPKFRPNLTPKEVLQMGSFGGTYFRPIRSSVTGKSYRDVWKEFPADWFEGLDPKKKVANPNYADSVNKYGVSCGGDLHMWESSGWMRDCDPYGWFQWYCRFYLGRRCDDDERQISRGLKVFGPTGRWRTQLCNRILVKGTRVDDRTVSPKIRQLMQHWGYKLTDADLQAHASKPKK